MISYSGRVAIVTGGGGGLGREYALMFGNRGAKVVVNDLGGALSGDAGGGGRAADAVVEEIRKNGGEAVANYDSVEHGDKIVQTAIQHFGRVDILINNAGILRDVTFRKMSTKDWDMIMLVHLKGAYMCCKAVWPHMVTQGYGRIVNTASAVGLYGNFGQTNYGTAKAGLVGLTRSLAMEGAKNCVFVNCIAPLAGTRMTASALPPEVLQAMSPQHVAPLVGYLASEDATDNGQVFEVGAGWIAKVRWQRSPGRTFNLPFSVEDVKKGWEQISDFSNNCSYPISLQDSLAMVSQNITPTDVIPTPTTPTDVIAKPTTSSVSKSDKLFELIGAYLKHNDGTAGNMLTAKVGSGFHFEILPKKGAAPSSSWTIDLKNGNGKVVAGKQGTADATFTMTDADFQAVCLGKLNPQVAFMQGKMKIKGNMRAATKFTPQLFPQISASLLDMSVADAINSYLGSQQQQQTDTTQQQQTDTTQHPVGGNHFSAGAKSLRASSLLSMIESHLAGAAGADIVAKVGCVYRFDIIPKKGASAISFTIDLKNNPPSLIEGAPGKSDAHFTMLDDDFIGVVSGKLNPQIAFMQGKMKIKGNMRAAMKFTPDLFPKPSKL
eukprot:GHVS01068373.1.p1 GENE.GHVS01068373.1~~GHVS01068373.1.p1  ORF type:complete len:606 (-),score=107.45 GHVS01068373.1:593-2410(-)